MGRNMDELRKARRDAEAKVARIAGDMQELDEKIGDREPTQGERERWDRLRAGGENARADLKQIKDEMRSAVGDIAATAGVRTESGDGATGYPQVMSRVDPWAHDTLTPVRDKALAAIDRTGIDSRSGDRVVAAVEEEARYGDRELSERMVAASSPDYRSAFTKLVALGMRMGEPAAFAAMTEAERGAVGAAMRASMQVGSNPLGGYLVPTHLDPTIILTNSGWTNPLREIARVITLTSGNVWNGVTSAGVSASYDTELAEVSDDTPNDLGRIQVPVHMARAFVQFSLEMEQDDPAGVVEQMAVLFADAKGNLESSKFSTGSGTNEPTGLWTALDANTNVEITSTTAASIGTVDLHSLYRQVPVRWRRRASWLMNPVYALSIKSLGTAVSASFTGDLTKAPAEYILDRPVVQDDYAPSTQTTTSLDPEVVFGDFTQFAIVDKIGMNVELLPTMLGSNRRPVGARGLFAYWRNGSDTMVDNAFRLLLDKTSA